MCFWELSVFPTPQTVFALSTFPEIPKRTVSPCSSARTGDVGSVSEQKLWKLIEKGLGNFSWY